MICGEKSSLMRPEFLELCLEELVLVIRYRLFVEN